MSVLLEPGASLGPYSLVRPLGTGASAEVWEAVLEGPGGFRKPVALKLLRPGLDADPDQRAALMREARLGARLQHPHVVGTLLLTQLEDRLCVALELVRGCTATELLRRLGGPLPPRALLDLALQASLALHYIHTFEVDGHPAGLVHRDLKPSNLLVDTQGVVKLADLGISLVLGEGGGLAGTPGYLSPEQAEGQAEPRSDLFSLGATLYTLATGRMPFGRGLPAVQEVRRVEAHLARPGFLAPLDAHLPGLAGAIRSCLRLRPEDRPPTADALHQELRLLLPAARQGPALRSLVTGGGEPEATDEPSQESRAPTQVSVAGNLRQLRDGFVGRREELDQLSSQLEESRWMVILGPGGLGKTRLALELARAVQRRFPGGAWAFDLTEARSADGVCAAVAAGLDIPLEARDPALQLGRVLAAKGPCLVVLDNLEQCVHALPETLERWRTLAPEVRFLGTSRVRPGLSGEVSLPLGELNADDAARLFRQRAPRPLTPAELPLVPSLCDALERVPLALELAAARLRVLGLAELSRRLSLKLLGGGGADRPERHRSLQASLGWSWELLTAPSRAALLQVSVFDGGFDWAGAEAVLDLGPDAPWTLDVLQELVDASLLRVDRSTGRFSTWQVVREFAGERLVGEARREAELRHGRHHASLDPKSLGLARELDNLVAACRNAVGRGDAEVAVPALELASQVFGLRGPSGTWLALAGDVVRAALPHPWGLRARCCLGHALFHSGRAAEAARLLEEARADLGATPPEPRPGRPTREAGRVSTLLGMAYQVLGRNQDAADALRTALDHHRHAGDTWAEGSVLNSLGSVHLHLGQLDEARRLFEAALAATRESGNRAAEGVVLGNLAVVHSDQGRQEEARAGFEAALARHREVDNRRHEGIILGNLGNLHRDQGRYAEAGACYESALQIHREVGSRRSEGIVLGNLGHLWASGGRSEEARRALEAALVIDREVGNRLYEGEALGYLGDLDRALGRWDEARRWYLEAEAVHRAAGNRRQLGVALDHLGRLETDRERWDEALRAFRDGEEVLREAGDPLTLVNLLIHRSRAETAAGATAAALRSLDEAERAARPLGLPEDSELARELARARDRARAGGG